MVFRDSTEEAKMGGLGTDSEPFVMFDFENHVMAEVSKFFGDDMKCVNQNWQMLVHTLSTRRISLDDVSKGILNREMVFCKTNCVGLQKKSHSVITRNGDKHSGQASDDGFLPGLHDDAALYILARSSRSDYPKLSCLNRKISYLIDGRNLYKLRRQLGIVEHWVYLARSSMPGKPLTPSARDG